MKKRGLIVIAVVFTLVAASGSAFAWGHGKGNNRGNCPGWVDSNSSDQDARCRKPGPWADLSQEQRDQLKALHQSFVDDTADARIIMLTKHEEMRIIMKTSNPDHERLSQLNKELGDLKIQIGEKRLTMMIQAKKIAPDLDMGRGMLGFGRHHKGISSKGYSGFKKSGACSSN